MKTHNLNVYFCGFFALTTLMVPLFASNPFSQDAPFEGLYLGNQNNAEIRLRLVGEEDRYSGSLTIGTHDFKLEAKIKLGRLVGETFNDSGDRFSFVCMLSEDERTLIIERASGDISLSRVSLPESIWGCWEGEGIELFLSQPRGQSEVKGLAFFQDGKFPVQGTYRVGQLQGSFQSEGQTYPIEAELKDRQLVFASGTYTQTLVSKNSIIMDLVDDSLSNLKERVALIAMDDELLAVFQKEEAELLQGAADLITDTEAAILEAEENRDALILASIRERRLEELYPAWRSLMEKRAEINTRLAEQAYGQALMVRYKDNEEAFKLYKNAALRGHAESQNELGYYLQEGLGVDKNQAEALKWYRAAAQKDLATAQYNLGNAYWNGWGIERNYVEAVYWFQAAAKKGDVDALRKLGWAYKDGRGVEKDDVKSTRFYIQAADKGNKYAQYWAGNAYQEGRGVPRDYQAALEYYRKAASQGYSDAMNQIGWFYDYGYGILEDKQKAVEWYRKAADAGNSSGMNNLAYAYHHGEGVSRDYELAEEYYRKAEKMGYENAQINLYKLLEEISEIEKERAGQLEEKKANYDKAMHMLSNMIGIKYKGKHKVNGHMRRSVTEILRVSDTQIRLRHRVKMKPLQKWDVYTVSFDPKIFKSFYSERPFNGNCALISREDIGLYSVDIDAKLTQTKRFKMYALEPELCAQFNAVFNWIAEFTAATSNQ